jgi:hypothetical protein
MPSLLLLTALVSLLADAGLTREPNRRSIAWPGDISKGQPGMDHAR